MACGCREFIEVSSGGVVAGGAVTESLSRFIASGGAVCGGSADVDVPTQVYDGLTAVYPLDEESSPYLDHVGNRDGTSTSEPSLDDGVACTYSQLFTGREFIEFPFDDLGDTWSVSLWAKVNLPFSNRCFFSRGGFAALGHTVLLGPEGRLITDEDNYFVSGVTRYQPEYWHHWAVSCDGSTMKVYLDGVLQGQETVTGDVTESGSSFAGKFAGGSFLVGNLQEVRIFPEVKSEDYFRNEYLSVCGIEVGEEEAP